jgi:hypothetical protein
VAITHPTGFPLAANADIATAPAVTTYTMPHAYANVGDLAIIGTSYYATTTPTISSIVGTKTGTWTLRERTAVYGKSEI